MSDSGLALGAECAGGWERRGDATTDEDHGTAGEHAVRFEGELPERWRWSWRGLTVWDRPTGTTR